MEHVTSAMDKVPPQNLEAEQSVLGSMMLERSALEVGLAMLSAEDFYRPAHQTIFDCLHELRDRDEPADLLTLSEELRKRGKLEDVGSAEYLMSLVDTVPTAANIEHYASIVEEKSLLRKLISAGTRIVSMGHQESDEIQDLLSEAESLILAIGQGRCGRKNFVWMSDIYFETFQKLPRIGEEFGVPIGLKPLADECVKMIGGELTIIGARPMVGKSTLAYQLLEHAARQDVKTAIISAEMTPEQYALRQMAGMSNVDVRTIIKGGLVDVHYDRLARTAQKLSKFPVAFYDADGLKMSDIRSACRRLYAAGVKLVAIDHMHCVEPTDKRASRNSQLAQISRDCKSIAKELNIPVLALAQLSRDIEKRGKDARPLKSDLKESGDIEANADNIWLLWRPEEALNNRGMGVTEAEIIIAKGRMLGTSTVKCGFFGRQFKFVPAPTDMQEPNDRRHTADLSGGEYETEEDL